MPHQRVVHADAGDAHSAFTDLASALSGLDELWSETHGDPEICVAILDGPVDRLHPALQGAQIKVLPALVGPEPADSPATRHGSHVASIIFAQRGPVPGLAPHCRGLSIPIFQSDGPDSFHPCSQLDLARAITQAVQAGAHIINISGGEFSPSGEAYPLLADVIHGCARRGILIIAAAGNQGCDCLHVPAAVHSVLAVGAADINGEPLEFSNWGSRYLTQGIIAPGQNIGGAAPGDAWTAGTGTSYATPVVSGVAALLLCLQKNHGLRPNAIAVRDAILKTAVGCSVTLPSPSGKGEDITSPVCRRLLAGRLNLTAAMSLIIKGNYTMSDNVSAIQSNEISRPTCNSQSAPAQTPAQAIGSVAPSELWPSACQAASKPQHVYVIGQIDYDFASEARLDSFGQKMARVLSPRSSPRSIAYDHGRMVEYLRLQPAEAASLEWTLKMDGTPMYAIRPWGPFAAEGYVQLRRFLEDRVAEVEYYSVAGIVAGQTRLLLGYEVPVIVPELRAMSSWNMEALSEAVAGASRRGGAARRPRAERERQVAGVQRFLERVHHGHRNLGREAEHRALNFAATHGLKLAPIADEAINAGMELHHVAMTRSPIERPGSECWDVEIFFFRPQDPVAHVKKVFRYTVDVSDVVPVLVGQVRSWHTT
jgi:subtilisin family serine protease